MSSPAIGKEVMRDHDTIFANRDPFVAAMASTHGGKDITWGGGHEWRTLRRVFVREMMSKNVLDSYYGLRRQEVRLAVSDVFSKIGMPISIREQMFVTSLKVVMSMIWGGTLKGGERIGVGAEFQSAVEEVMELLGAPNVSDLFPVLARFDLQGVERRMKRLSLWFDQIFNSVIDQRLKMEEEDGKRKSEESADFLQLLLHLTKEEDPKMRLTMNQLRAMLMTGMNTSFCNFKLDIVAGGTDTTSTTVE